MTYKVFFDKKSNSVELVVFSVFSQVLLAVLRFEIVLYDPRSIILVF